MKTKTYTKQAVLALGLVTSLFIASCSKNDNDDDNLPEHTHLVSGSASGSQEVPAVTSSGTGSLSGTYDANTNKLTYNITWTGLSGVATAAHLHGPAEPGVNAGVLLPLTITANAAMNGAASGSAVISDEAETALLNGNVYYNIHTVQNVDGEIRGQVVIAMN